MSARGRTANSRSSRMKVEPILQPVADQIKRIGAWHEFHELLDDGCNANELLIAFAAVVPYTKRDTWNQLFGFGRLQLSTAIETLKSAANVLQKLNQSQAANAPPQLAAYDDFWQGDSRGQAQTQEMGVGSTSSMPVLKDSNS
jgi:hypothetical protein